MCGRKITPFGNDTTKQGRRKWQRAPLFTHLKSVHSAIGELYLKEFTDLNNLVKTAKKNVTIVRGVDGYFQQKRQLGNVEVEEETHESTMMRI